MMSSSSAIQSTENLIPLDLVHTFNSYFPLNYSVQKIKQPTPLNVTKNSSNAPGSALAVLRDETKQFNFNRLYTVMIFGALFIGAGLFFIPVRGYLYLVGFAVVGLVRGTLVAWLQTESVVYGGATCNMCYALQLFATTTVVASGAVIIAGCVAIGGGIWIVK